MSGRSQIDNPIVSTLTLLLLIAIVVAIWLWLPDRLAPELTEIKDRGVFGDSYGAVTSLFTGLGFAGLVFTVLLQQREIKLQREDFFAQIQEMQLARDEVARQSRLQELQLQQSIVQLKIAALQAEIEYVKLDSLQWIESARAQYAGPKLKNIQERMNTLIGLLEASSNPSINMDDAR